MTKLTELEKQKAITCVDYQAGVFACKRYKLEIDYDKLGRYDETYDQEIEHAKEMEEFYSNLAEKLKEVL